MLEGALHARSSAQIVCRGAQWPVLPSHISPSPQAIGEPGTWQPATHCCAWHTAGAVQLESVLHPEGVGAMHWFWTQTIGLVQSAVWLQSTHCWRGRSQCLPMPAHCVSLVQLRRPTMQTPVSVLHFWLGGQASSFEQPVIWIRSQVRVARLQNSPPLQVSSFLQPAFFGGPMVHRPPTHCAGAGQSRAVTHVPLAAGAPLLQAATESANKIEHSSGSRTRPPCVIASMVPVGGRGRTSGNRRHGARDAGASAGCRRRNGTGTRSHRERCLRLGPSGSRPDRRRRC